MNTNKAALLVIGIFLATTAHSCGDDHGSGITPDNTHQCEIADDNGVWDDFQISIAHNGVETCPVPPVLGQEAFGHRLLMPRTATSFRPDPNNANVLAILRPTSENETWITQNLQNWVCPSDEELCEAEQNVTFDANETPPDNYNFGWSVAKVESFNVCTSTPSGPCCAPGVVRPCNKEAFMKYKVVWGNAQ